MIDFIELDQEQEIASGIMVREILFKEKALFKASFFSIGSYAISPIDKHKVKEVWIIVEGQGELVCKDQTKVINKGEVVYFDSFVPHSIKNLTKNEMKIISIWWD